MKGKNGSVFGVVLIVGALFLLMLAGVILVFGSAVLNLVMDEVVPELQGLGTIENANLSQAVEYSIVPVNNVIQSFTWMAGVIYIFGILAVFGLAFAFRYTSSKWMLSLFLAAALILILGSLFVSNIYEEFHNGTDDIASHLQEHVLLSFLLIHSPMIMSMVVFIAGIILFGGDSGGGI